MSQANEFELEMLALINADRAAAGLNALQLNTALNDSAEDHSAWMLQNNIFDHAGAGGSSSGDRMADAGFPFEGNYASAENIGWQSERGEEGISDDVEDVHQSLMDSPEHRANLLNPNLTEIGIGIERGEFTTPRGTFDGVMVTQNFAATDGDTSSQRDPGATGDVTDDEETEETPVAEETPEQEEPPVTEDTPEDTDDDAPEEPVVEETDDEDDAPVEPVLDDTDDDDDMTEEPDTDDDMPDAPVAEAPTEEPSEGDPLTAGLPALAAWFGNLADTFEFRQEGDTLVFETAAEDFWDNLEAAFADVFDFDLDDNPVETDVEDAPATPDDDMVADMSNMMFDCA